jgi:hypothetical protein
MWSEEIAGSHLSPQYSSPYGIDGSGMTIRELADVVSYSGASTTEPSS